MGRRALLALGVLFLLGVAGCAVLANSFQMSDDIGPAVFFGPPPIQDSSFEEREELRRYGRLAYVSNGVWTMNADGTDRWRLADVPATPPLRWSPDGSRLAFGDGRDLYIVRADGTGLARLTHRLSVNLEPAWSPDGRQIAFASDRSHDFELYVMRADGSHVRRLTRSPGADRAPAWSPEGESIAFETTGRTRSGRRRIDVVELTTGRRRAIAEMGEAADPAWSADGERIAFVGRRPGSTSNGVFVADADGGEIVPIAVEFPSGSARSPAWSPDDDKLAFSDRSVWLVDGDGDGAEYIAGWGFSPVWSPDGEKLAFLYAGKDGRRTLYAWPFDDSGGYGYRRLTPPLAIGGDTGAGDLLAWQPSGRHG